MYERKKTYEWVLVMSKGEPVYLTENRYKVYFDTWRDGQIMFDDLLVNPSFVVQAYKREADTLFEKYPCQDCRTKGWRVPAGKSGSDGVTEECPTCEGTGLNFNV